MNDHIQNPFSESEIDIREYVRILYEKRWLIVSITVILCTLSLIRSFMMEPVYEASTKVLIQKSAPKVVNMQEVQSDPYVGREYYQTQYKILKSRIISERVNKELGGYIPWSEWTGRKKIEKDLTNQQKSNALLSRISIKPIPSTHLVDIMVEDVDPNLAVKIANMWAENYIAYVLDVKFDASRHASEWLQDKIKDAKDKLEESEYKLQKYRKKNNLLMDTGDDTGMMDRLLERKADLEIELSEKKEYYKDKHPEIIGIRSEIDSVDGKIKTEREKELETGEKSIEYNMLKRAVTTNKDIYESLLKRIGETEVTGGLKTTNISIVDKAVIPGSPSRPKKKMNLLIALFVGFFARSALAFLMDRIDQSIKSPEDLKRHVRLPVLGSVAMPTEEADKKMLIEFIAHERPRSTIAEAYRGLRTSIMFTAVEHKRKVLLFTSSGPKEGKTTTAVNLAIVMAQSGENTLLLDADLRQPRIEKTFGIKTEHGLSEILAVDENLEAAVHHTDIPNLDVIACGVIPPNPSELLGSKKMDALIEELEKKYDRIIIDSPPVLAVTDAVVLAGKVDGTILVVKCGETHRNAALQSKEILESVKSSNVIGAVLNMVERNQTSGYYYYYGKYGKYGQESEEAKQEKEDTTTA